MGFSTQEYWSGLPCPPAGDLPDPGIQPMSLAAPALKADSIPLSHQGSPIKICTSDLMVNSSRYKTKAKSKTKTKQKP